MKIVADENIALLQDCFGTSGDIMMLPGRSISAADVRNADALLVRSVTRVDSSLLAGSAVRFVGTTTAGFDHIDKNYLESHNIHFSHASGCNAVAVCEYVLAALDVLARKGGFLIQDRKVGIVGKGQIGRKLYEILERLDVTVLSCDSILEHRQDVDERDEFVSLEQLLNTCDVISLHTPLTFEGMDRTHHLINSKEFDNMLPGTILINTSRGGVINNRILKNNLQKNEQLSAVLDVWEFEPDTDPELVDLVDIATPHIAGYSMDAKIRGTQMIYRDFCQFFNLSIQIEIDSTMPTYEITPTRFFESQNVANICLQAIRDVYDICEDDRYMRQALSGLTEHERRKAFDELRRKYPARKESDLFRQLENNKVHCKY